MQTTHFLLILLCSVLAVWAQAPVIPIITYNSEHNPDGTYRYSYETGTGISAKEEGYIKNRGIEEIEAQVVEGSYSYTDPDGRFITVTYIADENGFRPRGTIIHPSIARAIDAIEQDARVRQSG